MYKRREREAAKKLFPYAKKESGSKATGFELVIEFYDYQNLLIPLN